LLSELLCFTPPTTATSAHLFPCSNAPVTNKSKDTGRCYFLIRGGFARDYNLIPRHLPALFATTMANAAASVPALPLWSRFDVRALGCWSRSRLGAGIGAGAASGGLWFGSLLKNKADAAQNEQGARAREPP
jgi:hypothetical protein